VNIAPEHVELVISDIHHRISGVSATVRALIPELTKKYKTALIFQVPIAGYSSLSLLKLFRLLKSPLTERPFRIWHVRRNNEMLWAIIARDVFGCNVKLVFTSVAIRQHSWYPRQLIKRMDAVIAGSHRAATYVDSVAVVPHGVDLKAFSGGNASSLLITPWLGFKNRVGIVGRVRPEKGTDLFVESMIRAIQVCPDSCAVIVGKTTVKYQKFKDSLLGKIEHAGLQANFFFLDEVEYEQMPDVYAGLDIVCTPALYEGFGLVPIEAMVSGTAIIASKTGAYEDMVVPGLTGELIECGDSEMLFQHLREFLDCTDLVTKYKLAGKDRVFNNFAIANEIEGISAVYSRLWNNT